MKHYIKDNVYYIEDNTGKEIFNIKLDESLEQVSITTAKEVYTGPIDNLWFREDPPKINNLSGKVYLANNKEN